MKVCFNDIFSIRNIDFCHKCISILGIKFIFHRKNKKSSIYENLAINNNKILFKTTSGSYSCNPKYIAEEIIRRNLSYEIVWSVNNNILKYYDSFPENINLVMEGTQEDIKQAQTARIIVDNERRGAYTCKEILKREGQVFIQTFHGSMGFKKTGTDRGDAKKIDWSIGKKDSSQIDYLTSNSKWETDFFKRLFFGYGNIIETGHPRNDILFKDNNVIKDKIYNHFNIPRDRKIVLYAPTLREDKDMSCYTLDYRLLEKNLSKKFGGDWVLVARLHPWMIEFQEEFSNGQEYIDATTYPDIQELLAVADVAISDYSSCLIDFSLTRRPAFIYATDLEKYNDERGLYYPLESTPYLVAKNNDELTKNIENFDSELYNKELEIFLQDKGCIEDGHASERVVDLIEKIMKEGNNA